MTTITGSNRKATSQSAAISEKQQQLQLPPDDDDDETDAELITTELLLHRLNVGLGIAGGARGSLTKVAGSVLVSDDDEVVVSPAALVDLRLLQIEMTKLVWIAQRQARELEQWQNKITNSATNNNGEDASVHTEKTQDGKTLHDLRNEWHRLQVLQSCFQEYEGMAQLVMENGPPGQSESQLHSELLDVSNRIQTVQAELDHTEREFRMRQNQFHHFLSCLQDLKQTMPPLNDDDDPDDKDSALDPTISNGGSVHNKRPAMDVDDNEAQESSQERRQSCKEGDHNDPMQIDEHEKQTADGVVNEDADLYGDL